MTSTLRIGDKVQCGFAFRDAADNSLVTPAAVSVEIYGPQSGATPLETITDADARVQLGSPVAADIAARLLQPGENNDGTGLVKVLVTPDAVGSWTVYCADTSESGAEIAQFRVGAKHG